MNCGENQGCLRFHLVGLSASTRVYISDNWQRDPHRHEVFSPESRIDLEQKLSCGYPVALLDRQPPHRERQHLLSVRAPHGWLCRHRYERTVHGRICTRVVDLS